ncbi:cilia- and flagella-associated protein 57-like [Oncorhynchus masou masou]|uniref:cilia- and flagella-associated protein 57-like n=1 Tax=Oncorhynchus masou masou TaxID=90313 RepID=UPI003182FAC7
MASVVAQCHYIFGLRTGVINNICYFDEQTVIFPCGNNCVRYNIDQRWQRFIPGTEKSQGMQALAISANRRYLAVSERGEKGTITVYDLQHEQSRKRKVLSGGEVPVLEFVSMAFSPDSKYLIGQAGAPDWTLFYWMWEKQKVMASVKTTGSTNPINQVSFNPQDNTQICVSGNGVFKLFRYAEGALKQSNFLKLESHNFLSHTWMSEERVIAGTETGRLLVFESGDLRWEMSVTTKPALQEADRQLERRKPEEVKSEGAAPSRMPRITAITSYSKGFACSAGPGTVCLFEKTEEKDNYRKTREIRIPADPCSNEPSHAEQQEMVTLCISPSEETLVTSTDRGQLYSITLSSAEMSKGEQAHFEFLSHSFHSNTITGLSICIRKPLIATCSLDHSVRIWNFETNVLELHKEFQEEAFSVALHPSGLFILVGFSDKLRLMNLLIDDVRTFKEFTVRGCRECVFSHGGHMFAAVNGNLIHIYSSTTFDNLLNLKGHNGKVRAIVWSTDDSRLVSCGMDGAVYEWNTLNSKRESESVLKSCSYTGVTISPDAKTIFAVGTDCTLKEIQDCQILREVAADDVAYTTIAMSRSGRVLFAGTSIGTVRAIKYPLSTQKDWIEYQAHSGAVTKMVITFDDQYLLTVSEDCCLLIWKIIDKEGRGLKRDKDITYAEEILITKSDLEEKNQIMMELKTRVEELKMENEYQLRLKDMNYNEKIKDLSEKFVQEIESLKTKNQVLKTEKEKQEMSHLEVMREVVEKHSREQQDFESTSNQKLMLEYEKYQELQLKSQLMQEGYERQLQAMVDSKGRALEELTLFYEAKLQEKMLMLGQCQDESRQQMREFEESKKQMEEDGDREIQDIRIKYERKLRVEKEINLRLKGETGVMRKKFSSMQKDIDDRNVEIEKLRVEQQKLRGVIKSLEKDILGLKKEIQERDETIQDKEKRIYDLKKKNQELEKFKFVLDYKIKELKKQIEPRENDIKEMKEQIQEMEGELDQVHKRNTQLELNITELKLKLKATDKEMHKETQRVRDVEALVRRFKTDLHNCVGFIQEPKRLKDSIRELYDHYVQQSDVVDIVGVDADIQREYSRQREHLERNVASLKRKLAKDTEVHRTENVKIMKENVSLIKEINDLRRELRLVRTQVHDNKSQSGISKKKLSSSDLTALTSVEGRGLVARLNFEEEAERIIQLQRVEIQRLKMQMQGQSHSLIPPSSSTKLPVLTT